VNGPAPAGIGAPWRGGASFREEFHMPVIVIGIAAMILVLVIIAVQQGIQ